MEYIKSHKNTVIIGSAVGILVLLILISSMITHTTPSPTNIDSNTVVLKQNSFQSVEKAPTIVITKRAGVDIKSPQVQTSIKSLAKLNASLPFTKKITVNTLEVTIYIPKVQPRVEQWILNVYIDPIVYEAVPNTPEYDDNKRLFLTAAKEVYAFIKNSGINPEDIIVKWGDRAFMQKRAEEWLSTK